MARSVCEKGSTQGFEIRRAIDGTLSPPEIGPRTFYWEDEDAKSDAWVISIRFQDNEDSLNFITFSSQRAPQEEDRDAINKRSLEKDAEVTILGVNRSNPARILSTGEDCGCVDYVQWTGLSPGHDPANWGTISNKYACPERRSL